MTPARYIRTPKGILLVILVALLVMGVAGGAHAAALVSIMIAAAVAMVIDGVLLRIRRRRWHLPDGALLTTMILGMIVSSSEPWYVVTIGSVIAIVGKHVAHVRTANVFNPAALGLVAVALIFGAEQDWWGALGALGSVGLVILIGAGAFIANRLHKLPSVVAFLGAYYALVTLAAFIGDPARVAELFRTPDLNAALFFAFLMVTDPPTSPPRGRQQVSFAVIVGVTAFACFEWLGTDYYLLVGVLIANVIEGVRRWRFHRAKDLAMLAR